MFHNIRIDLLILKTYYGQFTLTTKKSLHIIFKYIVAIDNDDLLDRHIYHPNLRQ